MSNSTVQTHAFPRRVLLAEDSVVNQQVAAGLLRRRGHTVVVVGNGRDAVEAATGQPPFDAVLMDIEMPGLDGFEASEQIRARERLAGGHVSIIAMTAHDDHLLRARCRAAEMDGHLSKPIEPGDLYAAVEGRALAETAAAARPTAVVLDRDALLARVEGDEALLATVVGLFLDIYPHHMDDIRKALDARDAEHLRTAAHALMGAAGNCSALSVASCARELELLGAQGRLDGAAAAWGRLTLAMSALIETLTQTAQESPCPSLSPTTIPFSERS